MNIHDTLLLFGASGDLSRRYLFPSLVHLMRDRLLPEGFRLVAIGRQAFDEEGFRDWLRTELGSQSVRNREALNELLARTHYVSVDLNDPSAMSSLLSSYADRPCVSYLAIPPNLFVPTCEGLQAAGLLDAPSRLVLEKPIGHDLASSRGINAALRGFLDESRIFRIDHYLGKAPVQNLLALRFSNTLMEAVWHNKWIESVDIMVAETAGVDGREGYYAQYGALRDMVQNHMLQLLALVAMEPPSSLDADSLRDEKRKVLRALRPMGAADAARDSVRGRYQSGVVDGSAVPGFTDPSDCETFVALRAYIDNWRWAGVPFRLVTGKRLAQRTTEVVVSFKAVSHWIFDRPPADKGVPNRLVMQLQPEENIGLCLMGSLAAPEWGATELQSLSLDLSMTATPQRRIAYERLLLDALHGNQALFVTGDEVEAAWSWIDSISDAWLTAGVATQDYAAGSWGPAEAADFLPVTVRDKMSRKTSP
ncbi:MAG TPA: glucose-6-phosphate dehydrogenase [Lysobacter sp.]|nr:glucose-6-phosphate dehydrogenase [Lysobacter sp.]